MKPEAQKLMNDFFEVFKTIHQYSYHKLEKSNIYPGQPKLLALIRAKEGITQTELSQKNCVKPSTITGMLNKLEASNYVYRIQDEVDRRIMRVYLTPEGHHLAEKADQFIENVTELLLKDFSDEEIINFTHLIEKMQSNLIFPKK